MGEIQKLTTTEAGSPSSAAMDGVHRPAVAALRTACTRIAWLGLAVHAAFLTISIAGMQIGLAISLGALIVLAASGKRVWRGSELTAPVVVLCAGAISAIVIPWAAGFSPLRALDVLAWRAFAAPLVVVLALEAGEDGEDRDAPRRRAVAFFATWAVAALIPAALAWFQVRSGLDPNHWLGLRRVPYRAPAPGAPGRFAAIGFFSWYTRLAYAMLLVAAFASSLALLAPVRRGLRAMFGLSAVAAAAAVVLSDSRAAWGALWILVIALAVLAGWRVARFALPFAVVIAVATGAASPELRARLVRLATSPDANADRLATWSVCSHLVREHPLTGVGFNSLGTRIIPYFDRFYPVGETRHMCHDAFYSAWAEGGPLFALAIAVWWILLFRAFLRARRGADALGRAAATGVLAGLAALFSMSLVHDVLWASEAAFGMGALVAAGSVLAVRR